MDHSHKVRRLKLAFGTCIVFATSSDAIWVAADTERTEVDFDKKARDPIGKERVCKTTKLGVNVFGKNVYAAIAGLTSSEDPPLDPLATCKQAFDPGKTVGENRELIESDLGRAYRETIKALAGRLSDNDTSAAAKSAAGKFRHTLHVALFGFEREVPVISAIKFVPGSDNPKRDDVVGLTSFPSYAMGFGEKLLHCAFMWPDEVGIIEQLETAMNSSYSTPMKCPEYAILRVGLNGEEEWPRPSEACKDF